ncbi:hypothetical protein [Magnetococcus marinus]|uniref:hypothetical protein n=1 Tax=Magnetococcus marinus TaxID=1124597 RepID=UPI00031D128B|nr:hypothetical protein [Magnetococcus marinus]
MEHNFDLEIQGADIRSCPYCGWINTPSGFKNYRPFYICKGCQQRYTELTPPSAQPPQKKEE